MRFSNVTDKNLLMKIMKLNCNYCGAKIQIASTIKYFNCLSCGSSLTLIEKDQIVYTAVVENNSDEKTSVMVEALKPKRTDQTRKDKELLIEAKIARLDRDWIEDEDKNHKYLSGEVYIVPQEISTGENVIAFVVCIILYAGLYFSLPYPINLIAIIFSIVVGGIYHLQHSSRLEKYSSAKQRYLAKRSVLLRELKK